MPKPHTSAQRKRRSSASPTSAKVQRWIDLLAAMLSHNFPVTFDQLRRDVPAYAAGDGAALMRMFERDKDELRAFGVPIETAPAGDSGDIGYRLRHQDFYLPFLAVATTAPGAGRRAVPPSGYRSVVQIAFEPDELEVLADAAARVRQLGDPGLAADVDEAMRKLAFDLPPDAVRDVDDERVVAEPVDGETFTMLTQALLGRKFVSFHYHAMSSDETRARQVEPYGLAFLSAHWYLVARDRDRGELRTFRVNRMAGVATNRARAQSPDFEVPSTFRLEEYLQSRDAWTLGNDRILEAIVEFTGTSGIARAGAKLGAPVPRQPKRRQFQLRRLDTFARWLLGFAGEAIPIEPPELVRRYDSLARQTLTLYQASP